MFWGVCVLLAARMLDEHFEDQMNEIIKLCPVKRQTMLFSATMTDQVCYWAMPFSCNQPECHVIPCDGHVRLVILG